MLPTIPRKTPLKIKMTSMASDSVNNQVILHLIIRFKFKVKTIKVGKQLGYHKSQNLKVSNIRKRELEVRALPKKEMVVDLLEKEKLASL